MTQVVRVRTGARLHFGLWGIHAPTGRRYGGVGMMIAEPGVDLTVSCAERERVDAPSPNDSLRIERSLQRLRGVRPALPPVHLRAAWTIAPHQGLGSGTQLGLATAAAVLIAAGDEPFEPANWAHLLGRGERSSIGVHGFESGGFLVEAGQLPADCIGERLGCVVVCDEWRIVLIAPPHSEGLSGTAERTAFQQLGPMTETMTTQLRTLAVEEWLPAMQLRDFATASRTMWAYGQLAGEYFRPVQGGLFASSRMDALSVGLRADGFEGIAQTSWGPTIAVLCQTPADAQALVRRLQSDASNLDLLVRTTRPLNHGATITRGNESLLS